MWRKVERIICIIAVLVSIAAVKTTIDCSYAEPKWQVIASLALLVWFIWSVYIIDEKRRNAECRNLSFEYSRTTDSFPDEFEAFCNRHRIGATEAFVKDAVRKEMFRIEAENKYEAEQE